MIPENAHCKATTEAHPGISVCVNKARYTILSKYRNPTQLRIEPAVILSRRGKAENEVTAVHAKRSILIGEYFVWPLARCGRSKVMTASLSPSQLVIPRRKRCCSRNERSARTARRLKRRKSPTSQV